MHHLFKNVAVFKCSTEIAAGAAVSYGSIIDTRGYRGIAFIAELGTLTTLATNGLHAEMANTTATTDMIDVEDSGTTGGGDVTQGSICILDLGRPLKRYYRPAVDRATANSVITSVLGFLYNPVQAAVTHDSTYVKGSTYLVEATTGASTGS